MMDLRKDDISIVVFGNRRDYFFTKICISSIRYYYPDVEIFLVKDNLNGKYNTSLMRKVFNVKLLKFDHKYFGWGASKIHFLLRKDLPKKRYLILDSDIIFVGKALEQLNLTSSDFVVAPENLSPPFSEIHKQMYIDPEKIKKYFPKYEYPGFFFNTGQMIVTPGLIEKEVLEKFFDYRQYPYYKDWEIFKTVDQSILNSVIPVMMKVSQISLERVPFMRWSVSYFENGGSNQIESYLDGNSEFLIHYCGDIRTHKLSKMKGTQLLQFFNSQFCLKISPFAKLFNALQDRFYAIEILSTFNRVYNDKYIKILKLTKI